MDIPVNNVNNKQPKKRNITQKDVAKRARVSTSIVSYVMNGGPRPVSEEARHRVLEAIEELGYRPNKHAQQLMREKWDSDQAAHQFGVILGSDNSVLNRPFYSAILGGIYEEAHRQGLRIRFIEFYNNLHDPILFNELIHTEEISGLILFPGALMPNRLAVSPQDQILLERILERIDNIVCVERGWRGLPSIAFNKSEACRTAVAHLIKLHHERIGYVGAMDESINGYRQAHFDAGLDIDPTLIVMPGMLNNPEEGYQGALELMRHTLPPDAIFAASDEVAIGVLHRLGELGVSVPQELALASIDDIPLASYISPALTTVRVPHGSMGAYAVRALTHKSQPGDPSVSVVLPTELIVRESCGSNAD